MKNVKYFIFLSFFCIYMLSACSREPNKEIELSIPTSSATPETSEITLEWSQTTRKVKYGVLRTEYDVTTYNGVTYYLESDALGPEEKEAYVKDITTFLESVYNYGGQSVEKAEISLYVGDCITTTTDSGEVYLNTEDRNSVDAFFKVFMAINEDYMNWELAYGIATSIWEAGEIAELKGTSGEKNLGAFFSEKEQLYLLDFTLPMFEEKFFEKATVDYVRVAAQSFTEYCEKTYGTEEVWRLCMDTSLEAEALLKERKNEWLRTIDVENVYEEYSVLPFTYNYYKEPSEYPYVIKGESANWYFSQTDVRDSGYLGFLDEYLKTVEIAEEDFAQARATLIDFLPKGLAPVDIFTAFYDQESFYGALYFPTMQEIRSCSDWANLRYSLLHEYVHHLTLGQGKVFAECSGLVEGVTEEIATIECQNNLKQMAWAETMPEEDFEWVKSKGFLNLEDGTIMMDAYNYYWSKEFYEGNVFTEYMGMNQMMVSYPEEMTLDALAYCAGASMTEYLIEMYGMRQVFEACMDEEGLEALSGRSFQELYDDWGKWNYQKLKEITGNEADTN